MKKAWRADPSALLLLLLCPLLSAQTDPLDRALADLQRGHFGSAEQTLRTELQAHPKDGPALEVLAVVLDKEHKLAEADGAYRRALALGEPSPGLLNNYGNHLLASGKSQEALTAFLKVLALDPAHANARVQAAHLLFHAAEEDIKRKRKEEALKDLAQAAHLAPERADVQALLGRVTADLGYYGDSLQAWERYIALAPHDDAGRRERGFAKTALGIDSQAGLADLEWFAQAHPEDAVGHYELAVAVVSNDPARASAELDRALEWKNDFAPALVARGLLRYKQGNPSAALPDLEHAARLESGNARVLDRLGQAYLALDRPADALRVLRKANALDPHDSITLMHLAHALAKTGDNAGAAAILSRLRETGPNHAQPAHPAGLVSFLDLAPEEQYARYRAGVERTVRSDPTNAAAQVEYLKILLDEGKHDEAQAVLPRILALSPSTGLLDDAARALLRAGDYDAARKVLDEAQAIAGANADLLLDAALATFHLQGGQAALAQLERIPPPRRTGDYYLAEMQMLDQAGRQAEESAALEQALRSTPRRPELYEAAAQLLTRHHQQALARRLLREAERILPEDDEILSLAAR